MLDDLGVDNRFSQRLQLAERASSSAPISRL
jgi:hypothetical protein